MLADDVYDETTSLAPKLPGENEEFDEPLHRPRRPKTHERPDRKERRTRRYLLTCVCVLGVLGALIMVTIGAVLVAHADDVTRNGWVETLCTPLRISETNSAGEHPCLYLIVETNANIRACAVPASIVRTNDLGTAAACGDEATRERVRWNNSAIDNHAPTACLVPRSHTITELQCQQAATSPSAYEKMLSTFGTQRLVYLIDTPAQGHAALYAETNTLRTTGAAIIVTGLFLMGAATAAGCWARIVDYCVHRPQKLRNDELRRRGILKDATD